MDTGVVLWGCGKVGGCGNVDGCGKVDGLAIFQPSEKKPFERAC